MKTKLLFLFAWLMLATTGCSADEPRTELPDTPSEEKPEEPVEPSGDKKVLVVYFSHTGNTRTIAGYIHDTVKSDLMEIKTADTYTDDYDALLAQIREEVASEYCPPLTTKIENISSYDVVFIGYPIFFDDSRPCRENRSTVLYKWNQFCRGELPSCPCALSTINRIGRHTDSSWDIRYRIRPCHGMVAETRHCETE